MNPAIYIPPTPEEIPDIPLYMDQLMEFMDKRMLTLQEGTSKSLLTKTMVNNYVKWEIIGKPLKKKYAKEQMMELLMVCHWKNVLTMEDMAMLMNVGRRQQPVEALYAAYRAMCHAFQLSQASPSEEADPWSQAVYSVIVSEWNRRKAKEMLRGFPEGDQL
jgi:hypothetical protein